jgi:hypothetical protein
MKHQTKSLLKQITVFFTSLIITVTGIFAQPLTNAYFIDSGKGSDNNNGMSLSTPFKTISRAKKVIQSLDKTRGGDVTVYLRGGIYFQDSPLAFNEIDGGTNSCKIIYRSYKDEMPVISGGQRISGWKIFDKSKNIFRAAIGNLTFRQLYINGNWGTRARTPDIKNYTGIQWDTARRKIIISNKNIAQWQNFNKVEIVTTNVWTSSHLRLDSFTTDSQYSYISLKNEEGCVFSIDPGAFHGKEYFFENAYEFLDSEGEWYLNTTDHYVYYKPRVGEDMSKAEVIAPKLTNIVRIEGKNLDSQVGNLKFKGISFMHSTWLRPDTTGNVEMQATQYWMPNSSSGSFEYSGRPECGILVKNAHDIIFERCIFSNMGATALDLISGTHDNMIVGNVFRDIAGNAVSVGLTAKETETSNTVYNPSDAREIPANILISNNYITRIGKDNIAAVGIMYGYARDIKIVHNEIENVPYTGISGGWGWIPAKTLMGNNMINNNYIHNFMKIYYDGGGIYTLSYQANSVCSDNYIENMKTGPKGYGWMALYADAGTRGLTIKNNVCEVQQDENIRWLYLQVYETGAKDCPVDNNYTNSSTIQDNKQPVSNTHYYPKADWPKEAMEIIRNAGLEAAYKEIKDDLIR